MDLRGALILVNSKFKTSLFALFSAVLFSVSTVAQCPELSVSAPGDEVIAGESMTFSANIVSGESKSAAVLSFNWAVSAGTINSGQGTSVITVDTADLGGQSVTATLELGGLPASCSRTASATGSVRPSVVATKIHEFGAVNEEVEWAKLDNFVLLLQNEPNSVGYLISYRGPKGQVGEAKTVNARMVKYLIEKRAVKRERLKSIDGGMRQTPSRELWIVPLGAKPPKATPMAAAPKPGPIPTGTKKKP